MNAGVTEAGPGTVPCRTPWLKSHASTIQRGNIMTTNNSPQKPGGVLQAPSQAAGSEGQQDQDRDESAV